MKYINMNSKKNISLFLILIFIFQLNITSYAANVPSSWAQAEVNEAISEGLVPDNLKSNYQSNISRQEFCQLVIKMFEAYSKKDIDEIMKDNNVNEYNNPFKEQNLSKEIIACYKLGIVNGDDTGYFRPYDNINRQEAAKILTVLTNIFGKLEDEELIDFEDKKDIQKWATEYVDFVVLKGIMNGVKAGTHIYFKPKSGYTKEQAILTINRLYKNVTKINKELVYNVENFITNKMEGLNSNLKIYNFEFDKGDEKYNNVDVSITSNDYEFKIVMSDVNKRTAEINVIGKYIMLATCELDGNVDESEIYLKYADRYEKEYVKILKYEGDHFDTLLTLASIEYFGNEVKGDGNGKVFGIFHTLTDGTINGYYDINEVYTIERVLNKNASLETTVKENMIGAVIILNDKEVVLTNELRNELHLNIGDKVTVKDLYKYKNYVTVITDAGKEIKVAVTK